MKRPAASVQSGATEPKQAKTGACLHGGAIKSPVSESGGTGLVGNLSSEDVDIEALFLAVRESQPPNDPQDVALCLQVYKLKRYPLRLKHDSSMARNQERRTEDALRQRLWRRIPAMSKACQAYLLAMKQ